MKFTLSWLKAHLETEASVDDIVEAMTMAGLEVEHVDNPAEALSAFTVAHVISAEKHPDADKLKVCSVETFEGIKQIVCGAPNAHAGMKAVYAPLGTYIPGADFALDKKPRKIRGIESHGMLCSAKELNAGEDHDGIIDLKGDWQIGAPAAEALGANDPVIDFEVTPNRPDWLGVDGIARDLAAAGLGKVITPAPKQIKGAFPCPIEIRLDWPEACPVFAGRYIRGVKYGPSPDWLKRRLEAIGLRPINILADITNFVSYDRCRPLHVYDADKIGQTITARRGTKGDDQIWNDPSLGEKVATANQTIDILESGGNEARRLVEKSGKSEVELLKEAWSVFDGLEAFRALDGRTYWANPEQCVIADDRHILGYGGVMGGEMSGVTNDTVNVFLESAWFDPEITRATGRATGIESDARYRFERGVDTGSIETGIDLATQMIVDLCGGEVSEIRMAGEAPSAPEPITFPVSEVKRLTGLDLTPEKVTKILMDLGFGVAGSGDTLHVEVPTFRRDCTMKADLVEEIARIHGYNKIEAISLPRLPGRREPTATEGQNRARHARRALAVRGYHEAVTWSFCHHDQAALFGGHGEGLELANPISSDLDVMRPTALIHLLTALQENADKGIEDPRLFEAGPVYLTDKPDGQRMAVAGVRYCAVGRHWAGTREADLFDAKADAIAALEAAGAPVDSLQAAAEARNWWHPGRSGVLRLGPKNVLAEFGELHPRVLKALGVEGRVIGFEILLDGIPSPKKKAETKARPALDRAGLTPVKRDFAFLVDSAVAADTLVRAAKGADKAMITDVSVFDVYAGKGVPEGQVSLAIEAVIQPREKTLTDKEIDAVAAKIVASVEKATGAALRG